MKHLFSSKQTQFAFIFASCLAVFFFSCKNKNSEAKEEQITVTTILTPEKNADSVTNANSIQGNISFNQIATNPNSIILTGLANHRLLTIYKSRIKDNANAEAHNYSRSYYNEGGAEENDTPEHFMPGIDILAGYNLLNIAHYDLKTEKLSYFFNQPVLIKTLYYPCFKQDSLHKKPITRNYYLVSVYDEDTNKDTLINKKDLRRFYYIDENNIQKTRLLPADYSVIRAQYDSQNDAMYLFAKQDVNKNGSAENNEPMNVFWVSLKAPTSAKKLY
jgi:hypothetical protein